mmetsp:Transcript_16871/g.54541  ORF Transcript_16871/g.54541 Transcript_16871/m.54541 type:complete len:198 (-) Transcript_16871:65-658(-)
MQAVWATGRQDVDTVKVEKSGGTKCSTRSLISLRSKSSVSVSVDSACEAPTVKASSRFWSGNTSHSSDSTATARIVSSASSSGSNLSMLLPALGLASLREDSCRGQFSGAVFHGIGGTRTWQRSSSEEALSSSTRVPENRPNAKTEECRNVWSVENLAESRPIQPRPTGKRDKNDPACYGTMGAYPCSARSVLRLAW